MTPIEKIAMCPFLVINNSDAEFDHDIYSQKQDATEDHKLMWTMNFKYSHFFQRGIPNKLTEYVG